MAFQDGVIDLNILRGRLGQMARFPIECVRFCTLLRFVHEDGTEDEGVVIFDGNCLYA